MKEVPNGRILFAGGDAHGSAENMDTGLSGSTAVGSMSVARFTAGPGTILNNYNLPTSASGAGHITAKSLTITTDDKSFMFGSPLPTLTASFNAFALGEGFGNLTGTLNLHAEGSSQ